MSRSPLVLKPSIQCVRASLGRRILHQDATGDFLCTLGLACSCRISRRLVIFYFQDRGCGWPCKVPGSISTSSALHLLSGTGRETDRPSLADKTSFCVRCVCICGKWELRSTQPCFAACENSSPAVAEHFDACPGERVFTHLDREHSDSPLHLQGNRKAKLKLLPWMKGILNLVCPVPFVDENESLNATGGPGHRMRSSAAASVRSPGGSQTASYPA